MFGSDTSSNTYTDGKPYIRYILLPYYSVVATLGNTHLTVTMGAWTGLPAKAGSSRNIGNSEVSMIK
jgi:hypothetical protein